MRHFNFNALTKAVWLGIQYELSVYRGEVVRSVVSDDNDE